MRHIAAYLLLQIGGNTNPSAEDVKRVLAAVGIEADDARLTKLIQLLEGKDINEIIASGSKELAVPAAPSRVGANSSAAGRDLEHGRKVEKDNTELDGDGSKDDDSDDGLEIIFDGLFS